MEYSDCDSIRTEDFASKFCEYVHADIVARARRYKDFPSQQSESRLVNIETRISPVRHLYNQTLDLESIATEIFDDQLQTYQDSQQMSGRTAPTESCSTSLHLGNLSNVQPMRRDIMNKFLTKYSLDEEKLSYKLKYPTSSQTTDTRRANNEKEKHQNDRKEVNWKGECRTLSYPQLHSNKNLANNIRQKSLLIQNEIHEERRRKLDSISEPKIVREQTPREQLDIKVRELDQLTDRMRKARADRERISEELADVQSHLKQNSLEVKSEKRRTSDSRFTNDNVSYQTVAFNQNVQSSQNQLSQLNAQLNDKKSQLKDLEGRIRQRIMEIQDLESIGLSKEEIHQVIEERNELYEILRQSEENGNDRYELEKQLTMAKEDLSMEYKRSREKMTKLEEELDCSFKKISDISEERDRMTKELQYSKETMQKQQEDINEIYTERNDLRRQIEKFKEEINEERISFETMLEQEKKRFQCHLATEEAQTKMIIGDLKNQLSALQSENISNVDQNSVFKLRISQLESECRKLKSDLESQENEFREQTERIVDEKNEAIEKIRKEFYSKKENEIQTLKIELDSEQMRTINSLKECYKQQNGDLQMRLETKSQEIQDLKSDIRRVKQDLLDKENSMKGYYETEISKIKDDAKRQVHNSETRLCSETETLKERYEGLLRKINQEIDEERSMNARLKVALEKANTDIARESELAQKFKNEKVSSINKLKETAKSKLLEECKYLKEYYEKELEDQLKMIEQSMQEKNSQLIANSEEIRSLREDQKELKITLLKGLSDLFNAIQHQCSQMANEAKFISPSFKALRVAEPSQVNEVVQSMIENFQISCQEYSQYFHELLDKMSQDKEISIKSMEEKMSCDLQVLTEQILKDHAEELNDIKMHHKQEINAFQLNQQEEIDNLRRNVKDWKQKTADRLAQKLQKEFCKEIERKSSNAEKHKSSSLSLHSFKNDGNPNSLKPIGLIEDLRSNIRQLRDENLTLRKEILTHVNGHDGQYMESRDYDHHSVNGSIHSNQGSNRGQDIYRQRRNSTDASMTRNGSFTAFKQ